MDSDQGVAVAALVQQRQLELEWGSAVALGYDPRSRREHRPKRRRELPAEAARVGGMGDRGTPDRIDDRRERACSQERQRPAGGGPRRRPRARSGCAGSPPSAAARSRPAWPTRRPGRAPRSPARPSPRTGRARARRRPRPGSRTAPRARGPTSDGWRGRGARPAAAPPNRPAITLTRGSAPAPRRRRRAPARRPAARARAQRGPDPRRRSARPAPGRARAARRRAGSSATRNCASPCCRVPTSSPSPRSSRSISASSNPSRVRRPARCSRAESLGPNRRHSDGCSPRPIRPAQLVQLRDPVAIGVLDQHHGRVGDVDPDLDHRGGHEHVGAAARRTRPSPPAWRPARSCPCISTTRKSRSSPSRRRSNSAVAARACSTSDSSTSGQTTNAWRPGAQLLADPLVRADRSRSVAHTNVCIGWRPLGQLAQQREVEVAVAEPAPACAGSASRSCAARAVGRDRRPWRRAPRAGARRTGAARRRPRRPSRANATVVLDQRVGADDQRQLAAGELAEQVGAGGRRGSSPSAARPAPPRRASATGSWRSAARPASRWAPSAPPGSRARPRAATRTARPRSCPSRPPPSAAAASAGRGPGRASIASSARSWSPVSANGSSPASHRSVSSRGPSSTGAPGLVAGPAAAQQRQLGEQQLVEREPAAGPRRSRPPMPGSARRSARRPGRPAARRRAARPTAGRTRPRCRRRALRPSRRSESRTARRWPGSGRRPPPSTIASACGRGPGPRSGYAPASLPWSISRVPGGYRLTSHGWLKNVAFIGPLASATVASTSGRMPRRRTGRELIARTCDDHGRALADDELRHRPRLAAVTRQMLEQIADRVQRQRLGRLTGLGAVDLERPEQRRGPRIAHRGGVQLGLLQGAGCCERGEDHPLRC